MVRPISFFPFCADSIDLFLNHSLAVVDRRSAATQLHQNSSAGEIPIDIDPLSEDLDLTARGDTSIAALPACLWTEVAKRCPDEARTDELGVAATFPAGGTTNSTSDHHRVVNPHV
jgi:hypothetical protein